LGGPGRKPLLAVKATVKIKADQICVVADLAELDANTPT
jgi:hypothetical protein